MTANKRVTRSTIKKKKKSSLPRDPYAYQHKEYLTLLSKSRNKSRRNKLIDIANNGEIQAVSECIMNIIDGNVPVNKKELQQLTQHKQILRSLANKCFPIKKKKTILKQKGGFLNLLVPLAMRAIPLIMSALSGGR